MLVNCKSLIKNGITVLNQTNSRFDCTHLDIPNYGYSSFRYYLIFNHNRKNITIFNNISYIEFYI